MKKTILQRRIHFKQSSEVNFDRINGFLSCMEALNNSDTHTCLYEFAPVKANGNRRESLIAHLNATTQVNLEHEVKSWNWDLRLVKSETPLETLADTLNKHFFFQENSPTSNNDKTVIGFINLLLEEIGYHPIKFYEAITKVEDTWHESWWSDYLIDAGGPLYHLHFGAHS